MISASHFGCSATTHFLLGTGLGSKLRDLRLICAGHFGCFAAMHFLLEGVGLLLLLGAGHTADFLGKGALYLGCAGLQLERSGEPLMTAKSR